MSKYQAYPNYKESGEEWLGSVPDYWDIIQIKHLSVVKRGASPRPIDDAKYFDDDGEYAWTRIADVTASDVYLINSPQRLSELGSSLSVKLEPESLFLSIAGTVGKPCITGMKACIHDGFVYFPELKIPSKFLFYVFAGEQAYKGLGKFGTQLNLNTDTVGGIKIGCTSNVELENIVNFLDHETAKIDTLIEKQQQLIKLLKEKRQAVIIHAVTKGLNPKAPMRHSGVEWIDKVPVHWKILRLSFALKLQSGDTITSDSIGKVGKYLVYGGNGVRGYTSNYNCDGEYVLIGRQGALCGNINMASGKFFASEHAIVVYPKKPFKNVYLAEMLRFMNLGQYSVSAAQPGVSVERLDLLKVIMPPENEQIEISKLIIKEQAVFESLTSECENMIALLQERRTALISAAVTGKIDVRNWQPPKSSNNKSNDKEVAA